jgi:hypothetical protein
MQHVDSSHEVGVLVGAAVGFDVGILGVEDGIAVGNAVGAT